MSAMLKWSFFFSVLTVALFVYFDTSIEAREVKSEKDRDANEVPRKWCIAKPSTPDIRLEKNIQYVCIDQQYHQVDCSIIKSGGSCFNPSNEVSHASMVMNLYFQADGQLTNSCTFSGTGMIVEENPSIGSCIYPPTE